MKFRIVLVLILVNIILWGSLVYYFKVYPFDDRIIIRDRSRVTELCFYKYSFYDSAKFLLRSDCVYVNPPDYDQFSSYYDNRPFDDKNGEKTVILTKNTPVHIESVTKLLRREEIDKIYVCFSNLDFSRNRELLERIKEKNIYFRFYFENDAFLGEDIKFRFVYPARNVKKPSGGFVLEFMGRKLAFFSKIHGRDRKRIRNFLQSESFDLVKLPLNGNMRVYRLNTEYVVVNDDLSVPGGVMRMKHHLFYSKRKKKIFRTMLNGDLRVFADEKKILFYSETI